MYFDSFCTEPQAKTILVVGALSSHPRVGPAVVARSPDAAAEGCARLIDSQLATDREASAVRIGPVASARPSPPRCKSAS